MIQLPPRDFAVGPQEKLYVVPRYAAAFCIGNMGSEGKSLADLLLDPRVLSQFHAKQVFAVSEVTLTFSILEEKKEKLGNYYSLT